MSVPLFGLNLMFKGNEIYESWCFVVLGTLLHSWRINMLSLVLRIGVELVPNVESLLFFASLVLFFSRLQFRYPHGISPYLVFVYTTIRLFIVLLISELIMNYVWIPMGLGLYNTLLYVGYPYTLSTAFRFMRILFTGFISCAMIYFSGLYETIRHFIRYAKCLFNKKSKRVRVNAGVGRLGLYHQQYKYRPHNQNY